MNYRSRKNSLGGRYGKSALVLAGVFTLGAVAFSIFGGAFVSIVFPAWQAENAVTRTIAAAPLFFTERSSLVGENVSLKERVALLEARITSLERGRTEQPSLLALYGREPYPTEIAAAVLAGPPQTPYDVIVIDAGSNDGIEAGTGAYLPGGELLGEVSEVFRNFSRVKLYSASGEKTAAVLERGDMPIGLDGAGAGNFKITLPRDAVVEKGDRIISADIEGALIAVVEEVRLETTDSFKTVLARSPANIFALRIVLVRP